MSECGRESGGSWPRFVDKTHYQLNRCPAWRPLNSQTADLCIEAVEEVTACYAAPEIFNTDQGTIHKLRVRRLAFIELSRASP